MGDIPEQVFIDAAQAFGITANYSVAGTPEMAGHPPFRAAVASAYRAGQAATPDGPRRWADPDDACTVIAYLTDPGRLPLGTSTTVDIRNLGRAVGMIRLPVRGGTYRISVTKLTDATPAADGQDGDGRDG